MSKTPENKNQTINKTKHGKNQIPDYERLFQDGAEQEHGGKASAIPKLLLKQNCGKLLVSALLNVVKASPTWAIPLVTAEVINIITEHGENAVRQLILYGAILFVLLVQNIPTHVLYSRYTDKMLRTVGAGLRNTLIRKLPLDQLYRFLCIIFVQHNCSPVLPHSPSLSSGRSSFRCAGS